MMKTKYFLVILIVLVFVGNSYAQQFQVIPITPQYESRVSSPTFMPGQQVPTQLQPEQPESSQQRMTIPTPSVEESSEFEAFVSEKGIEITQSQLDILKKFEGITFSYSKTGMSVILRDVQ